MNASIRQSRVRTAAGRLRKSLLGAAVLVASHAAQPAIGQTHVLPSAGNRAKVEAEAFSAASENPPKIETNNPDCSGGSNVGYFWKNMYFDLDVEVPQMLNYRIEIQAASPQGTSIEVQLVDDTGATTLETIVVPQSKGWRNYRQTLNRTLSLPAGKQTLRFKNKGNGVNVDYIRFWAGRDTDAASNQPATTDGPDINPLKGFSSGWWRADDDFASVGFQYIEWGKLEPVDDVFDWGYVDNEVLGRAGTRGRHVILQFVVDWDDWNMYEPDGQGSHYKGPAWLKDRMGPDNFEYRDTVEHDNRFRITRATRYDNPVFIAEVNEAIEELIEHFKDDPRTFVVQVGALGFWGEWHTYPRPDWDPSEMTKLSVLGTYLSNLGDDMFTQVRYPDDEINLAFARKGMGYTNGSVVPNNHGYEFGEALAETPGELWRNGPVGGEWPPGIDDVNLWENFFVKSEGLDYIQQGRYSTILAPEIDSANPYTQDIVGMLGDFDPTGQFMTMHRAMGYNFQVNDVRYLKSRDKSGLTHFEVVLDNVGIAPFYKKWAIQLAVLDAESGEEVVVMDLDTDIRELGPAESITLAASIREQLASDKTYQIGLRIMQPQADEVKTDRWKLDARNTYIVVANDVEVIDGSWDANGHELKGGWNIVGEIQPR